MRTVASHPGQSVEITTENHRGGVLYFRLHFDPPSKLLDLPTSRHTLRRLRQIRLFRGVRGVLMRRLKVC